MDFFKEGTLIVMWRAALRTVISAAVFVLAGFLLRPVARTALSADGGRIADGALRTAAGRGAVFEILGGYRTLAADFAWIKSYVAWTRRDAAACTAAMELAVALDPSMKLFWREAAAITAFDYPHWFAGANREKLAKLKIFYGRGALKFIDGGLAVFPDDDGLLIQKASIAMANLDDYRIAEKCYEIMAAKPDAPVYILRRYAAILARNGKFAKSLSVMERMLTQIPADSPLKKTVEEQMEKTRKLLKKSEL